MMHYKTIYFNFLNIWLKVWTSWKLQRQGVLNCLDPKIVTSGISMVNVVSLLFIWKEMVWRIQKNGKYWILYMYTIVPQCKILNYGLKWAVRGADWLNLWEIMETMLTTFDLKRNDALQNNLVQLLKYLAESFDNLKIGETRNVELFWPPNSYILHSHGECDPFTLYLIGNCMKNPKNGKYLIL